MSRWSSARLMKSGMRLTDCEDGKFWVLERSSGEEACRIAAICREYVPDLESVDVAEDLVLQCDSDFKNPVLYIDGYLWELTPPVFSSILTDLSRHPRRTTKLGAIVRQLTKFAAR